MDLDGVIDPSFAPTTTDDINHSQRHNEAAQPLLNARAEPVSKYAVDLVPIGAKFVRTVVHEAGRTARPIVGQVSHAEKAHWRQL
jgi:hypothetical protein